MLAAYYERKGPPHEVLQVGELPDPEPGPGEVRVRVRASGVNPSDTKQRAGWGRYKAMPVPRIVPHNDGAGEVDAVGPGVPAARIGERVWVYEAQRDGRAFGTAAERVVVPARNAVALPDGVGFDVGAGLGVPAMTAHCCLFQDGPVRGQTVLVAGGAGSVGQLAVQLARWGGAARVIATAGSDTQAAVAREAGADIVLDYAAPDLASRIQDAAGGERAVDRVVEVAFGRNVATDAAVLRPGGTIASYFNANEDGAQPTVPYQELSAAGITVHFVLVYVMSSKAHDAAARDINAALSEGALQVRIARRFSLKEAAAAHDLVGLGGAGGKVMLEVP